MHSLPNHNTLWHRYKVHRYSELRNQVRELRHAGQVNTAHFRAICTLYHAYSWELCKSDDIEAHCFPPSSAFPGQLTFTHVHASL